MRIPLRLEPWLSTEPRRFRIAFRIRYALFTVFPRLGDWWIDR